MGEFGNQITGGGFGGLIQMAIAVTTAFGGIELIKYLFSLRANKRKDNAQAKQEEKTASQQDAELRRKELEVLNGIIETSKQQLEDMRKSYDEIRAEREELKVGKIEDRKIKAELRYEVNELKRQVNGLQTAFTESESRRIASERLYCSVEKCTRRKPPIGTYSSGEPTQIQPAVVKKRTKVTVLAPA